MESASDEARSRTFLRLIEEYRPAMHRLAGAYVGESSDRDDLVQEIATALWRAIPNYRGESTERTWIYRIAHNTAITEAAKLRRRAHRESPLEAITEPATPAPADDDLILRERRAAMLASIRALPILDRQITLLHLEGLSNSEIRDISGLTEGAVATRLSRIRDRLTEEMRKKEVCRR